MLSKQTQSSLPPRAAVVPGSEASRKLVTAWALLRHHWREPPSDETKAVEALPHYRSVAEMVTVARPNQSVFCMRLAEFGRLAERFAARFPGKVLYAVKCNPHPEVLRALHRAGIRNFDVASVGEIALIEELFGKDADVAFNNPAKSRAAIHTASRRHGVRHYVVDHASELTKLLEEVDDPEIVVAVRLATSSNRARYDLSTKFGATPEEVVALLQAVHGVGLRAGLAFHVGSQCLAPECFADALALCGQVTRAAKVPISLLNVGGGFPAPYPGDETASLEQYIAAIVDVYRSLDLPADCELLCEPGRALVATAASVVVQVVLRKDQRLYINDGVFGSLSELRSSKEQRPAKLLRPDRPFSSDLCAFKTYGPTCDSDDVLGAPLLLPVDTDEGDWIEIGMMGAYSAALTTHFNGFSCSRFVSLDA
jgi:ornithine decarboxylase